MGNFENMKQNVRIVASHKNFIESEAVVQLENTAKLDGIKLAVGLPDLHPGKGIPIGTALISDGWIYPHLIGNDIGCGMGLWKTDLKPHKLKLDKWYKKLQLDDEFENPSDNWLNDYGLSSTDFDSSLGTIGGGNHFAELQKVEEIYNEEVFQSLNMNKGSLYLLVHSGSRGLGENILRSHIAKHQYKGLKEDDAYDYIAQHNNALIWAKTNRELIAYRFLSCLNANGERIIDVEHNSVRQQNIDGTDYWIHRKGATPSTEGAVVISGSRGNFSYLVYPAGCQKDNAYSLAHGAGRKWKRSDAKGRLSKYTSDDFIKTQLGSRVICEDKKLMFEEAPQSYRNIEIVINDLVEAGIAEVVAKFRPLITYKTRSVQ